MIFANLSDNLFSIFRSMFSWVARTGSIFDLFVFNDYGPYIRIKPTLNSLSVYLIDSTNGNPGLCKDIS